MIIERAYKVELDLNNKQRTKFLQHAGTARFVWNWALARRIEEYQLTGRSSNSIEQHRQLNLLKKTPELSWLYDVSKCAPQEVLRNLDQAYQNFFRRVKNKENPGFPKFKKRSKKIGSFRLTGRISIFEDRIKLPRIGIVRLKEHGYISTSGIHILSVTCSEKAGHWFVSVSCRVDIPNPKLDYGVSIGIDLGIKSMAVTSDNQVFSNPRPLKTKLEKKKRLQRKLSKQKLGSNNRKKTKTKLAKLHYQIFNIRKDALHKATSSVVKAKTKPSTIVLEDLNVSGMLKNHCLAGAISDVGMFEFRRQIKYKSLWNGVEVLMASRFFPSSKTCSFCGLVNNSLTLSDREWTCICGEVHNRDLNAARNLANLVKTTVSSTESQACGQEVFYTPSDRSRNQTLKLLTLGKF
jgi:putative transposase